MKKVVWKVEGMDCTNCALSINQYLNKQGLEHVKVRFIGGDVSFDLPQHKSAEDIAKGIENLGYKVADAGTSTKEAAKSSTVFNPFSKSATHLHRFLFCLPFTAILMLHMLPHEQFPVLHFLMNPWTQLALCLPVYIVGMHYFGISAIKSLQRGMPNMNVLIATGATAAFVYSLIGTVGQLGMDYIFYETAATIITIVFLGEWVEHRSIATTQAALNKLAGSQKVMANMIAFDDQHQELIFPVESTELKTGDLVLIKNGEQVPADCKILWGELHVNEAMLTGESTPIYKQKKNLLTAGSIVVEGTAKAQVTAAGKDTVLSNILQLVKDAQTEKPPVQQLADRISAVFVPLVIGIAVLTYVINYFFVHTSGTVALMRSIAVLVISCPCAMGLATPAAIAVGLGRATGRGILFRNAKSLELFKNIKTVVFDKTGTLTTGELRITKYHSTLPESEFKQLLSSIEKYSNHPLAKAIVKSWPLSKPLLFKKVEEVKGKGMIAEYADGNQWAAGSYQLANLPDDGHSIYLSKNGVLVGWVNLEDELRPEAKQIIDYLHAKGIATVLLSGDTLAKTQALAGLLGIQKVYAQKMPSDKLQIIEELNNQAPVAMVGDGINDAPALAKATIGISMSDASQLAMQTAQVVMVNNGIGRLPEALGLGKHTYLTIKQNLFWAFIYNIVAIPVAAAGFLHPGIAALTMGGSDVVLAINSIRLKYKKVL